jgi:hypothetical protein
MSRRRVSYVIDTGGSAVAHTDRPHAYACEGRHPTHFTMVVAEYKVAGVVLCLLGVSLLQR